MLRTLLACAALAVALTALTAVPLTAAGTTATVRGVEAVNVRRGPGPETASFAMLRKGARVRVEAISGSWAQVTLASGERGYINVAYLDIPAGVPTLAEPTAAETGATPSVATPAPAAETPAAGQMEQRLEQALERIRALESARTTPSAADPESTPDRLAETPIPRGVELPTPGDDFSDLREIGPALALAGVGFVVGFLLGVAYGQRQERHRRSRVRF
jgi:uncharacterized protein YraI